MCRTLLLLASLFILIIPTNAQTLTQQIRGKVLDGESREPLYGATVQVTDVSPVIGAQTDEEGNFLLENVPVGRRTVKVTYIGYGEFIRDNLNINSAREYQLEVELRPGLDMEEVVVSAYQNSEAVNEFQVMSVKRLDPEELQYHAATGNDPSRLVQGLPGVQNSNDNRNEVVIRGNSPAGVLWRLEGIDIPNPNHYAGGGSSGGGITIFSASVIGSSDFSSGAFSAEYGNAMSGVFDMKFRVGNKQERQHTFRAGVLGLDIGTEGPIKKGKSSYVANFRYSTLGILNAVGIYLVGPRIANNFYDLSYKLHFDHKKTQVSVWGIAGYSLQELTVDEQPWDHWRQKYLYLYGSNTAVQGATVRHIIDNKSFFEVNAAVMTQNAYTDDDTMRVSGEVDNVKNETYINSRISTHAFYKRTFSPALSMKAGVHASYIFYNLFDQQWNDTLQPLTTFIDVKGQTTLTEPYATVKYRPDPRVTFIAGVHAIYFGLTNDSRVEPRLSAQFALAPKSTLALSYGQHSRIVPMGNYFTTFDPAMWSSITADNTMPHRNFPLIKSEHYLLSFSQVLSEKFRVRAEAYYQRLRNTPVSADPGRNMFMLDLIWGFAHEPLDPNGRGRNYGVDVMLEKFFDKGSFFILSGSWQRSQYMMPDEDFWRSTGWDSRFSSNFTGGQIFPIGENTFLETGVRFIYNAGYPEIQIVDGLETIDSIEPRWNLFNPNVTRLPMYFRPDLRIAIRKNGKKAAWWLALDIQNFINRDNRGRPYQWLAGQTEWEHYRQSPLTPFITFRIDI